MAKTRLSNWAQLMRARVEAAGTACSLNPTCIGHNVTNGYIEARDRSRAAAVFEDCSVLQMDQAICLV